MAMSSQSEFFTSALTRTRPRVTCRRVWYGRDGPLPQPSSLNQPRCPSSPSDLLEWAHAAGGSGKQRPVALLRVPVSSGAGMVLRLASDVLPNVGLSSAHTKAYQVLVDTFGRAEGATNARSTAVLLEKGLCPRAGSRATLWSVRHSRRNWCRDPTGSR